LLGRFPVGVVNPFEDVGRNDPCPCGSGEVREMSPRHSRRYGTATRLVTWSPLDAMPWRRAEGPRAGTRAARRRCVFRRAL